MNSNNNLSFFLDTKALENWRERELCRYGDHAISSTLSVLNGPPSVLLLTTLNRKEDVIEKDSINRFIHRIFDVVTIVVAAATAAKTVRVEGDVYLRDINSEKKIPDSTRDNKKKENSTTTSFQMLYV